MNGILYTAVGKKHYNEAVVSARSVRECMNLPITLVSDRVKADDVFDDLITIETDEYSPACKIQSAKLSPYSRTLMLDTDTYIVAPVSFDVLDRFDVAAVFEPTRYNLITTRDVPYEFPEFNSGVLMFKKCKVVNNLLDDWYNSWGILNQRGDQGALREALYYSKTRLCVLPPEYNYRFAHPACVSRLVRILHGPGDKDRYEMIRRRVNGTGKQRVLLPEIILARP